jgi:predicted GIY-YIG superfamily endonuclease
MNGGFVYIMANKLNGILYIGITADYYAGYSSIVKA